MIKLDGMNSHKEVDLMAGEECNTKSAFALLLMTDIVNVEGVLDLGSSTQW
jgi:hypothetical protein